MTERPTIPCARGCTMKCREVGCDHQHDEIRRPARVGALCQPCADRIVEALADIPDLWAEVADIDPHDPAPSGGGRRSGKAPASPALIRLDLMVLHGDGEEGDGVLPVGRTMFGWVQKLADRGIKPERPATDLSGVVAFLRTWHENLCAQPFAVDYYREITGVRTALRRALGLPGPIARCWGHPPDRTCGRLLYAPLPGRSTVTCSSEDCHRTYTGAELLRLAANDDRSYSGAARTRGALQNG